MHKFPPSVPTNNLGIRGLLNASFRMLIQGQIYVPRWILKALAPAKRHTAPRPAIEFHKPGFPGLVAEQFNHEESAPSNLANQGLRVLFDLLRHQLGNTRA